MQLLTAGHTHVNPRTLLESIFISKTCVPY